MEPKISVIVPVYQCEKYIEQCINSVLQQTMSAFELILVDDESPDGSPKICDEFATKDQRIRVIHKQNGGVSSARNVGLDNARAEYITFIDSDDFIDCDALEKLCLAMKDGVDLTVSGLRYVFQDTNESKEYKLLNVALQRSNLNEYYQAIENNYGLNASVGKLFKKSIIDLYHIRYREGVSRLEDGGFVVDYLQYCSISVFLDDVLYNYRQALEPSLMKRFHPNAMDGLRYYYQTSGWLKALFHQGNRDFYYQKLYGLLFSFLAEIVQRSGLTRKEQRKRFQEYLNDGVAQEIIKNVNTAGFSLKKKVLYIWMKGQCFTALRWYMNRKKG